MDILTEIKQQLSRYSREDLEVIAPNIGVPFPTLLKIQRGYTKNPRLATIEPILVYFKNKEAA